VFSQIARYVRSGLARNVCSFHLPLPKTLLTSKLLLPWSRPPSLARPRAASLPNMCRRRRAAQLPKQIIVEVSRRTLISYIRSFVRGERYLILFTLLLCFLGVITTYTIVKTLSSALPLRYFSSYLSFLGHTCLSLHALAISPNASLDEEQRRSTYVHGHLAPTVPYP
jgi:hypothetical protein